MYRVLPPGKDQSQSILDNTLLRKITEKTAASILQEEILFSRQPGKNNRMKSDAKL